MMCKHKWTRIGLIEYGEYCGNPNVGLLQCKLCKEVMIDRNYVLEDAGENDI